MLMLVSGRAASMVRRYGFGAAHERLDEMARSFITAKNTGTRIKTWMVEVIMPPTMGAAIGFMTSEPIPVSHKIGIKLASTAVTVISFGRSRCTAPWMV